MAKYVTHTRGHDAEWLLQNERAFNDRLVQRARAGRRPHVIKQVGDVGAVAPITDIEARAATRFVRRRLDPDAVNEVLQMLGLDAS